MSGFLRFSAYLNEHVDFLAGEVVEGVLRKLNLEIPEWEKEQAFTMYVEFLRFIADSLVQENKEGVPDFFIEWSKKNAAMQAAGNGRISEIAVRYPPTREVFAEILEEISIKHGLSIEENTMVNRRINLLLDISLNETIIAFEQLFEERTEATRKELAALSAPVIPVKDGIVVLPLVGMIDRYRADYIIEQVVPKIAEMDVNYVIADFSGIYTITAETAEYLHQIGSMLKLMGIQVLTTGLRPELAQIMVSSQIDLAALHTFANVKKALESLK
ncbi:STAS domain-containing protein [Domibacillus indicus]|uniref:STAS domain-containing protein n=1 Tax=Domibacillus indicus TaxID=1437523 RepID=UPI000617C407|nr:STAS domain-containing protein [Domibacillus indicus]